MKTLFQLLKLIFLAAVVYILVSFIDFSSLEFRNLTQWRQGDEQQQTESILRNQQLSNQTSQEFQGTVDDIIALVNQSRQAEGKAPVRKNDQLCQSALLKAQDMKDKNYFDHSTPEGLSFWFFVEKAAYKYKTVGENLAEGYFSANEVHDAWMDSEGHRKNILSGDFEELGVAIIPFEQNGQRSYLAVEHFGTPLSEDDLVVKTKCDLKSKKYCEDADERLEEIQATIDRQESIIKKAKKAGASKDELEDALENLENLERIEDELEEYQEKCATFIRSCDVWQ